ncbi:hypothetical protein PLESTB_000703500 [Pleodorina starrii]|uniref:Peptidase A2 domain-containing protein n=1 Tax=Pleodorina starrii TaxID=330485 RepID=A0A9W6BJ28_9CHLO|nr:hypothetical protein PLESTM_001213200 [Pleodorina starrii]GLC53059.1 hypothetical protein PLESTB_000703500 [Pleodorina starrii]GLC74995.1 hypothetical protein PLESTF_001581700 [Pleodorina starrii]
MASIMQGRLQSHYLASCRGYQPQHGCGLIYRTLMSPLNAWQPQRLATLQQRRLLTTARSTDEVAALAAEAQREALARERDALLRLSDEALRARLLKHGLAEQVLPYSREGLLDLLADASLKARSQVVSYPLRKSPRSPRAIKSFLVAPIDVEDVGFVNFLLDSGSSGALITAELRESLGLSPSDGQVVKGVDSSGLTLRQKVRLPPLRLGPQLLDIRDAYVTTLKSDHDIEVGGVLGLSFLRMFELEVVQERPQGPDGPTERGTLAFHPPGHIDKGLLDVEGMARLDCEVLKGGLLGVPVSLNGSARFPAILDLGANFSILNWPAAELAGVRRGGGDGEGAGGGGMQQPYQFATFGGQRGDQRLRRGFLDVVLGDEGSPYVPNRALALMVRDIPSFSALGFGDSPLMVLGYDLLSADRLVLDLRNQRIFVK